jgi:uncharacterized Zn finger protein
MQNFNPMHLEHHYSNLDVIEDKQFSSYAVLDKVGNHVGQIVYMGEHEWRYLIDNFPAEKKFYSNNLPVQTKEQFESDIQRIGLKLIPIKES